MIGYEIVSFLTKTNKQFNLFIDGILQKIKSCIGRYFNE